MAGAVSGRHLGSIWAVSALYLLSKNDLLWRETSIGKRSRKNDTSQIIIDTFFQLCYDRAMREMLNKLPKNPFEKGEKVWTWDSQEK